MKLWTIGTIAFACMGIGIGCATMIEQTGTPKHFEEKGGLSRAAFELSCDAAQLNVANLEKGTVGVSGCGKQAVYVYVSEGPGTGKYVNNTGVQDQ